MIFNELCFYDSDSLSSSGVEIFLERNSIVPFCLWILFAHLMPINKPIKILDMQAVFPIIPGFDKYKIKPSITLTNSGDATI